MGLLSGLLGHASETSVEQLEAQLEAMLAPQETIQQAYKLVRDLVVFTNRRLIFIDKQGITGSKKEYLSVPYRAITCFSCESRGHFDLDAEVKIWVSGHAQPISRQFNSDRNLFAIQRALAEFVCK
ncbi:PH domain-containing protein [Caldimonas tepidiphila]|uniref:PH domain-containing protein n=1 Tax=Caldimonas tepidiphila TaxID=2315841 RepID=UPI000E5B52C9|nr:PH domain-containing protein [Caldimonas tepidiphila]